MRSRPAEFMGLGHPLIDAIIEYFSTREKGVIAQLNSHTMNIQIRIEVEVGLDDDDSVRFYHIVSFDEEGNVINLPPDVDLNYIKRIPKTPGIGISGSRMKLIKQRLEPVMDTLEIQYRSEYDSVLSVQTRIVGVAV